jgi:hypothetical protein
VEVSLPQGALPELPWGWILAIGLAGYLLWSHLEPEEVPVGSGRTGSAHTPPARAAAAAPAPALAEALLREIAAEAARKAAEAEAARHRISREDVPCYLLPEGCPGDPPARLPCSAFTAHSYRARLQFGCANGETWAR